MRGLLLILAATGATTACVVPAPTPEEPFEGPVVYLNFADGTEGVTLGAEDDATRNASALCATAAFARWEGARGCGDRARCARAVRERVAAYFAAYRVRFTTARPPRGRYTMIIVAPPEADCSFGRRGAAMTDCGNENAANIAFAFDCARDVETCAALIAHEVSHTFGLVHVSAASDLMSGAPEPSQLFTDQTLETRENECGLAQQNAHATLLETLGRNEDPPR